MFACKLAINTKIVMGGWMVVVVMEYKTCSAYVISRPCVKYWIYSFLKADS